MKIRRNSQLRIFPLTKKLNSSSCSKGFLTLWGPIPKWWYYTNLQQISFISEYILTKIMILIYRVSNYKTYSFPFSFPLCFLSLTLLLSFFHCDLICMCKFLTRDANKVMGEHREKEKSNLQKKCTYLFQESSC